MDVLVLKLLLFCVDACAGEEDSDSDCGDSTALPVRRDSSEALAKEAGGELLRPVEADVNPNALKAEKRPLLEKPAPKLVRRGACE